MGARAKVPLASQEARWFLEGESAEHGEIRRWFEGHSPYPRAPGVPRPAWKGRQNDAPDVYLVLPDADDLGIKWREGELQVKGRVAEIGTMAFGERHTGVVERWTKWSYCGLPDEFRGLFDARGPISGSTVAVHKTRALRKVRLDTMSGEAEEVDASKTFVDRGLNIELADLSVDGARYCSVAFEAFPDAAAMFAAFGSAVALFMGGLTGIALSGESSRSYPQWLRARLRRNG